VGLKLLRRPRLSEDEGLCFEHHANLLAFHHHENFGTSVKRYATDGSLSPLLLLGDARAVLAELPDGSVDSAITSPPYWGKREYANGGIGLEEDYRDFIRNLGVVFHEVRRVLKPEGSFWLNIGDTYQDKGLLGIPWRVALEMTDGKAWTLAQQRHLEQS